MHRKGVKKGQEKQACAGVPPAYPTTIHRLSTTCPPRAAPTNGRPTLQICDNAFYVAAHPCHRRLPAVSGPRPDRARFRGNVTSSRQGAATHDERDEAPSLAGFARWRLGVRRSVGAVAGTPGGGVAARQHARLVARAIAPRLADALGQPVTVDNRVATNDGAVADLVAKAPPDGHTLLLATPAFAALPGCIRSCPSTA